jgi:hypothetical protein
MCGGNSVLSVVGYKDTTAQDPVTRDPPRPFGYLLPKAQEGGVTARLRLGLEKLPCDADQVIDCSGPRQGCVVQEVEAVRLRGSFESHPFSINA